VGAAEQADYWPHKKSRAMPGFLLRGKMGTFCFSTKFRMSPFSLHFVEKQNVPILHLAACQDKPSGTAITNVTVIDAVNGLRENQTVVFDGDEIIAVQPADEKGSFLDVE